MKVDSAGRTWITTTELQQVMYGSKVPEIEQWRRYYGKSVNTRVIEDTLRGAELGFMRDLADLGTETIRVDPHLAGILLKRMRAVGSIQPRVTPADSEGIDHELAEHYANMVRGQLMRIPHLRQRQVNLAWSAWNARACLEIEWLETNNPRERWRARDLHWIHPRRLSLGPEREVRINDSLYQGRGFDKIGFDTREIPFKFVVSKRQMFNEYPEREGLLIPALFYSYFKRLDWRERLALMELYGKPLRWLEVDKDAIIDPTAMDTARDTADDMGSQSAAALPPGMKLMMQTPGNNSSTIHKEIIDDCNAELSKLILGNTNTTDAQSGGLGSGQAVVHQDGETLVFTTDCDDVAEDWTDGLSRAIVQLNGGAEHAELYTPKIELAFEAPPDPKDELDRGKAFLDMGLTLKKSEVYERGGYTQPGPDDDPDDILQPPPKPEPGAFGDMFTDAKKPDTVHASASFTRWRQGRIQLSADCTKVLVQGVPVFIDRPKGFIKTGVDPSGKAWSREYTCDYGYIPNTQGGDGEGLDVFLGTNLESQTVYWVEQKKRDGTFDEYKIFIGFNSATEALDTYGAHVPTELFAGIKSMDINQLKATLGINPAPVVNATDPLTLQRAAKILALISATAER